MGILVQFRANSFNTGEVIENWVCNAVVGGDRKPKAVFNTSVKGNFITPQLTFSEPKLYFKYMWERGVPAMPLYKTLDIANTGPLPTTIMIDRNPPFDVSAERLTLAPSKQEQIKVEFDPGKKQDKQSAVIPGKITITHVGHPQKDVVPLHGQVCFPNLDIVPPNIDFGCILNDTSKKKVLQLTNVSEMAVSYEWSFLEEEVTNLNARHEEEKKPSKKKK